MTNDEIRNLAIECGATENMECTVFAPHELRKYTAVVEAREREQIASKIELMPLAHMGGAESIAKIVRELK